LPDHPDKKVLGVIRPTTEIIGNLTRTGKVGIFATAGTVASESYIVEIARFFPELQVFQQACPMWVPLVENHEINGTGTDYFVEKYVQALLAQCSEIDTIVLGCTHYPLLLERIRQFLPPHVKVLAQGEIVADRLADYLDRHPEIETRLTRGGARTFLTTDDPRVFDRLAGVFYGDPVSSRNINLQSSNSAP
jgi:glutamate racemase